MDHLLDEECVRGSCQLRCRPKTEPDAPRTQRKVPGPRRSDRDLRMLLARKVCVQRKARAKPAGPGSARILEPRRDAVDAGEQRILELVVVGEALPSKKLGLNEIDRVEIGTSKLKRALEGRGMLEERILV